MLTVQGAEKGMEGNRDEAIKCRELAEKYIREGNRDKALKFLQKSQRLYPSKDVEGERIRGFHTGILSSIF